MTAEYCCGTWAVLLDGKELGAWEREGREPAEEAARCLGCPRGGVARLYRGRGEALLFLGPEESPELFWFPDLEALLEAASLAEGAGESRLYASERGYLLELLRPGELPPAFWDLGRRTPLSARDRARLLLGPRAVPELRRIFRLD